MGATPARSGSRATVTVDPRTCRTRPMHVGSRSAMVRRRSAAFAGGGDPFEQLRQERIPLGLARCAACQVGAQTAEVAQAQLSVNPQIGWRVLRLPPVGSHPSEDGFV